MIERRTWTALASLVLSLTAASPVEAQPEQPSFQYRAGRESIPPASNDEPKRPTFSAAVARDHLETGAKLWAEQKQCVSCHTHGLFAFVRPQLSADWGRPPDELRGFLVDQMRSIAAGDGYSGSVPTQLAYVAAGLAEWDAHLGESTSPETDEALRALFKMQADDGSFAVKDRWPPLNSGTYHGTTRAAMAVAAAPGWSEGLTDDGLVARIDELKTFLRDAPPRNDHERLLLLWTSTRMGGLLRPGQRQKLVDVVWSRQLPDGGWSIRSFATADTWNGGRKAAQMMAEPDYGRPQSDGYQTGLAVVVLRDAGIPADDPRIRRAVAWLRSNQRESGRWWTRSLNIDSRFHYVTYSGTAYAVLALAKCGMLSDSDRR